MSRRGFGVDMRFLGKGICAMSCWLARLCYICSLAERRNARYVMLCCKIKLHMQFWGEKKCVRCHVVLQDCVTYAVLGKETMRAMSCSVASLSRIVVVGHRCRPSKRLVWAQLC